MDLTCRGCGGKNQASAEIRRAGWYRCSFCDTPNALEPTQADLQEGPASRVVVLRRLGRHQLIIPANTLLSRGQLLASLFVLVNVAALLSAPFELAKGIGDWRRVGPAALLGLVVLVGRWLLLRWRTEQHVEISPNRVRHHLRVGNRERRVTEEPLRGRGLAVDLGSVEGSVERSPRTVRLTTPAGQRLRLICASAREAAWTAQLIEQAVDAKRGPSAVSCRGCGAALAQTLVDQGRGFINCPYCGVGLLLSQQQTTLPPARLPAVPTPGAAAPRLIREHRPPAVERWRLRPPGLVGRWLFAVAMAYGAAMFGGMGAFLVFVLPKTPPGTIALKVYVGGGAAMMTALAAMLVFVGLRAVAGQLRITLADQTLALRDVLAFAPLARGAIVAPLLLSRLADVFGSQAGPPGIDPRQMPPIAGAVLGASGLLHAYRAESDIRLPLFLLLSVELQRDERTGAIELVLTTPTREHRVRWQLDPESAATLQHELLTALARRLQLLGREVELR